MSDAEITTRRALEICLSRLPMHRTTAEDLAQLLANEIRSPTGQPSDDVDGLRARLAVIHSETLVDLTWPKGTMMSRLKSVRELAAEVVGL